ncbi:hypothetical protein [Cyanobium sp. LEGE 06143]|uniref:hypothetical protein n=1 Tax=Cyanobium sp. LEGE 06143 TaxID=945727 RepID=UPI001881CB09|nr:hypothetical protein [Cyanobium sp. LEGE 06143]
MPERITDEQVPSITPPSRDADDPARVWRIRQWEAAGAPVPEGAPDPRDCSFGPRTATTEQLEGEELTVEALADILNMVPRAVSSLASKSYRMIESDLWDDLVSLVFAELRNEKADLADEIEEERVAVGQPRTPQAAALEARYESINSTLDDQSRAISSEMGWVEPGPKAREGRRSFMWQQVLLRKFPTHGHDLQPSRDCKVLRDPDNKALAFAIVNPGSRGRGNTWLFRRARLAEREHEWFKPPDYVMGSPNPLKPTN